MVECEKLFFLEEAKIEFINNNNRLWLGQPKSQEFTKGLKPYTNHLIPNKPMARPSHMRINT
jgi:hypothetical protein